MLNITLNTTHTPRGLFSRSANVGVNLDRQQAISDQVRFVPEVDGIETGFGTGNGTKITGVIAHAAVRMHAYPVTGLWSFCTKAKAPYFQRWKVATLS